MPKQLYEVGDITTICSKGKDWILLSSLKNGHMCPLEKTGFIAVDEGYPAITD